MLHPQQHHQQPPHHNYGQGGPYQGTHGQQPPPQTHQAGQGSANRGRPTGGIYINQVCCPTYAARLQIQVMKFCLFSACGSRRWLLIFLPSCTKKHHCSAKLPDTAAIQAQNRLHNTLDNLTGIVFAVCGSGTLHGFAETSNRASLCLVQSLSQAAVARMAPTIQWTPLVNLVVSHLPDQVVPCAGEESTEAGYQARREAVNVSCPLLCSPGSSAFTCAMHGIA